MFDLNNEKHTQALESLVKAVNSEKKYADNAKRTLWQRGLDSVAHTGYLYFVTGAHGDAEAGALRAMLKEQLSIQTAKLNKLCDDGKKFAAWVVSKNPDASEWADFEKAIKASEAANVEQLRRVMKGLTPLPTKAEKEAAKAAKAAAGGAAKSLVHKVSLVTSTIGNVREMTDSQLREFTRQFLTEFWDVCSEAMGEDRPLPSALTKAVTVEAEADSEETKSETQAA